MFVSLIRVSIYGIRRKLIKLFIPKAFSMPTEKRRKKNISRRILLSENQFFVTYLRKIRPYTAENLRSIISANLPCHSWPPGNSRRCRRWRGRPASPPTPRRRATRSQRSRRNRSRRGTGWPAAPPQPSRHIDPHLFAVICRARFTFSLSRALSFSLSFLSTLCYPRSEW